MSAAHIKPVPIVFLTLWPLLVSADEGLTDSERLEVHYPAKVLAPQSLSLDLGIWGGAFFPSGEHELYDSNRHFHSRFQSVAPKGGLRLGFFPLRYVGIETEAGYTYLENRRDEINHLFDGRVHAVVQWPARFTPFLVAGGGFLNITGDTGDDIDGSLHWGGGVKYYPNSWLHVRVDGRHITSGRQGPGTGNTHHSEVSLGLGFVLFRKPSEPLVVEKLPPPPPTMVAPTPEDAPAEEVVVNRPIFVNAVDPVRFGFDSTAIDPSFLAILHKVADLLLSRDDLAVVIVGHTDSVGSDEYNLHLSQRRAEVVALFLERRGVSRDRMRVSGQGEHEPLASNLLSDGRARNRRTEVTVVDMANTNQKEQGTEPTLPDNIEGDGEPTEDLVYPPTEDVREEGQEPYLDDEPTVDLLDDGAPTQTVEFEPPVDEE